MSKPLILMLALALCCGTLAACATLPDNPDDTTDTQGDTSMNTTQEQHTTDTEMQTYDPASLSQNTYMLANDTEHFKHHGRMIPLSDGLGCDHVMSGIEFTGVMYGQVKLSLSCTADTYFTVFVDGERVEDRFAATADTTELVIANFDTADVHSVRVVKQTEPQFSLCTLKSVTLTGELGSAPAQKPLYIEFLGDSITCGYGNLGDRNSPNPGTALWEDGTQAFAGATALALDADCSIISCSGIGANKGYPTFDMQQYYEKASYYRDQTEDHVFGRVPDVVVINLGTNDAGMGATEQGFQDSVKSLITFIRTAYGKDVPIVWVHNMMGECRFAWTKTVLDELGGQSAGIYVLGTSANHEGGNGHPTLTHHAAVSKRLTKEIQKLLQDD